MTDDGALTAQRRRRKSAPSSSRTPKGDGDGASAVALSSDDGAQRRGDGALELSPGQEGPATPRRSRGRPADFKPEFIEAGRAMAFCGATDTEMAEYFEVDVRTLYRWRNQYPDFRQALKVGKGSADDQVERSLYERANGYTWVEQQAIKVKIGEDMEEVQVVEVERRVPPDTTAAIFWLKNRRRAEWRDVQHIEGQAGPFIGIKIVTGDSGRPEIELSSQPVGELPAKPGGTKK